VNNDKSLTPDEQETSPSADSGEKEQAPGAAPSVPDKEETSPSGNQSTSAAGAGTKKSGGNKKAADKKHKSGRGKGVLWLLLIVLLAGAGGAWWWYGGLSLPLRLKQDEDAVPAPAPAVETPDDIARLSQQLSAETRARKALGSTLEKRLNEQQLALNSQASRLRELAATTRTDWLLAEAEYLLRLANQRLLTERNVENALSLLNSADNILRDIDDPKLLPVREALARNIVALKSQPKVDREGLFLRLKALAQQTLSLPMLPPAMSDSQVEPATSAEQQDGASTWYSPLVDAGRRVLAEAKKLVVVRHRADPVDPLLTPEQEQLLRLQLGALFEQAQLALLREEQLIYRASLARAREQLSRYFEMNDRQAEGLVAQLAELEHEQIVQVRPDISDGLDALKDYIDSWHNRHPADVQGGSQP